MKKLTLKLNIKKTKQSNWDLGIWPHYFMKSEEKKVEAVTDFIFLDSKITVDGDCSHEIRRWLLLGSKAMTNLDIVLKSRDITVLTKVCIVKAMVFPVVTYGCGCESWMVKKAECQKIDTFKLSCGKRLLRVPWTAKTSNQSNLKEINLNALWKDWYRSWNFSIVATWCKQLTH